MNSDITIIGGGIVGQVAAQLLAKLNLNIILINNKPYKCNLQFDARVLTISHKSSKIFKDLGIEINQLKHGPIYKMHVWDYLTERKVDFCAQKINLPNIGYVVEQREMLNALANTSKTLKNLEIIQPAEATELTFDNKHWQIKLNNGKSIKTKLLVGADGAHSIVRKSANIPSKNKILSHVALVTTLATSPHHFTAQQVFVDEGPVAVLPLYKQNTVSLVYSANPYTISRLKHFNETKFISHLNSLYKSKLNFKQQLTPRISFPLYQRQASQFISEQLVLLGDAVRSVHPLAGQGLNLGINDTSALYEAIKYAMEKNKSFYHTATLESFARQAKYESILMQNTIFLSYNSFKNGKTLLRKVANMGLLITDKIPLINKTIIKYALM